jgi:hypothetical protein
METKTETKKATKKPLKVVDPAAPKATDPSPVSAEAWAKVTADMSGVTTEELDVLSKKYQDKYAAYEAKKKESSAILKEAEILEAELIAAFEAAGKSKYYVEGIGTFYFVDKMSVKTPKTLDQKKELFKYIQTKYGETVLLDKVGIVSATLNSFYNSELEAFNARSKAALEAGEEFTEIFTIPGLDEPTNMRSLNLKKEKA